MALQDLVRPLKLESPATGGTQLDLYPTELDPHQDYPAGAGFAVQELGGTSLDRTVILDRINGALRLTDQVTSHVLGELVSSTTGQRGSHNALPDAIHFLGDGPGDGWASGAVCIDSYAGPLRTSATWYTDVGQTKRIVALAWTYIGPLVQTEKLTVYGADGVSVVRTVTDAFAYNGPLRTSRKRTWGLT